MNAHTDMPHGGLAVLDHAALLGRHGDNELVHMSKAEIAKLEELQGHPFSVNPDTGCIEMFSLWKLLAGIGVGAAGFFAGPAAPALFAMGAGLASSSFQPSASDILKSQDAANAARNAAAAKANYKFPGQGYQQTQIYGQQPPSLTGKQQPYFTNTVLPAPMAPPPPDGGTGMAHGGDVQAMGAEPEQQQAQKIVMDAVAALMHESPNPEQAINRFVETFGQKALQDLSSKLQGGESSQGPGGLSMLAHGDDGQPVPLENDDFIVPGDAVSALGDGATQSGNNRLHAMLDRAHSRAGIERHDRGGMIHGPGGGMEDMASAQTKDGRPVLLSPGEFRIPRGSVSILGGPEVLQGMIAKIRQHRASAGQQQPKPIKTTQVLPA